MAKSVLGNDPFLRGAAVRPAAVEPAPPPAELRAVPPPPPPPERAPEPAVAEPPAPGPAPVPGAAPVQGELAQRLRGALALLRTVLEHSLSHPALSSALTTAQGLARAVGAGLGTTGAALPDVYGRDAQLVEQLSGVMDFLYTRYWRVTVEGANVIPPGPVLLVANHAGAVPLDGPVLAEAVGRERPELSEARWLVEDQVFYAPFLGTLFNRLGAVRACPENAIRLLSERRPVIVFPEGIQGISKPFRERYHLKRFGRGGFVKIALRTGAPIIPVAIVGAEETLPLLAKVPVPALGLPYLPVTPLGPVPLPAKWMIRFGEPLDMGGRGREAADDLSVVQELTEKTRQSIEAMLHAVRQERGSVFAP